MPWSVPQAREAFEADIGGFINDGGKEVTNVIKKSGLPESLHEDLYELFDPEKRESWAEGGGERRRHLAAAMFTTAGDVQRSFAFADQWMFEVVGEWNRKGLDAVICPPSPFPAIHHDFAGKVSTIPTCNSL